MTRNSAKKTFERALSAHHAGYFQQAKTLCEEVLQLQPEDSNALHLLAMIAGQEQDYAQAITYLTRAIASDPTAAVLHNHLANFYYKQKNIAEAKNHYAEAIALQPDYIDAHYNLGLLMLKQGQRDTALVHFKNVILHDPYHFPSYQKCGDIYLQQEKMDEAIAAYQKALEYEPYDQEVLNNLGAAYLKQNNPLEAIKSFSTVLRINENNLIARSNLAGTLIQQERYRDAMWHYQRLLESDPNNSEGHYNLGVALLRLGELSEALHHFKNTVALNPEHSDARNNLGITHLKLGQKKEAAEVFAESLRLHPNNPAVQYLYDALTGKITPEKAPPDYVKELFDTYAEYYEEHVTEGLHYEVPKRLRMLVDKTNAFQHRKGIILDLGCGTGLSGQVFRDIASTLIGVDLSSRMVDMANAKKIYDELVLSEMLLFLKEHSAQFDLIIAADVLVYIGDLASLFAEILKALHPSGLFAFSTEISEKENYILQPNARYAHSKEYIEQIATQAGFKLMAFEKTVLRTQENRPVEGYLYVWQT